jgi:hypothetical protein
MLTAGVTVALGLLATIIAVAADRDVSSTVAATYYITGCVLFLVGLFAAPRHDDAAEADGSTVRADVAARTRPNRPRRHR